jgi:hypothetical protein
MKQTKFLYTDGRDVVVTQSVLQTKKALYRLKGITAFGLEILKPSRLPGLLLLLIGITLAVNGFYPFIPESFFEWLSLPTAFTKPIIQISIGVFILSIGIVLILLTRNRYAVRIETAEGDKDVVISRKKEYVNQILNAIQKAKLFKS